MSNEISVLEETLTGYAVTGLDGLLRVGPGAYSLDLNEVMESGEPIGGGEYDGTPFVTGNPTVYTNPEEHVPGWPCRLYELVVPAGACSLRLADGGLLVSQAEVVREGDSLLCLGPQRDELMGMAARLLDITRQQQEEIAELAGVWKVQSAVAAALRKTAELAERNNSSAVMNLMWTNKGVAARAPIGHAALAVAHRDLLTERQLAEDYEMLYRPWRMVMGEPAV